MVGSLAGCCARAARGHATAAPPSSTMNSRRFILRTLVTRSFCDDLSRGRVGGPAQLQDAGNRQANDDESADEHTDCGQSTFAEEIGFVHSGIEPSRRGSGSLLHTASRRPLRIPLARRVAAAACAAVQSTAPLFRRWRDRRQTAPATSPATRAAQAARIMQQMRSGSKQLHVRAEELDAHQEAKCQKREIDLVHDPPA